VLFVLDSVINSYVILNEYFYFVVIQILTMKVLYHQAMREFKTLKVQQLLVLMAFRSQISDNLT